MKMKKRKEKQSFKDFVKQAKLRGDKGYFGGDSFFSNLLVNPISLPLTYFMKRFNIIITPNQLSYLRFLFLTPLMIVTFFKSLYFSINWARVSFLLRTAFNCFWFSSIKALFWAGQIKLTKCPPVDSNSVSSIANSGCLSGGRTLRDGKFDRCSYQQL